MLAEFPKANVFTSQSLVQEARFGPGSDAKVICRRYKSLVQIQACSESEGQIMGL